MNHLILAPAPRVPESAVVQPLRPRSRAGLLVLTSSFPRFQGDTSAPYLLELYRYVRERWKAEIEILHPADGEDEFVSKQDGLKRRRFDYLPNKRWQKLAFGSGIPDNLFRHPWRVLQIPFFMASFCREAAKVVREAGLIHAHWILPAGLIGAILRKRNRRLKFVLTVHSSDLWLIERLPGGRLLLGWILSQADHLTLVSHEQRNRTERLLGESFSGLEGRVSVLPMGIHWERYQKGERGDRRKAVGLEGKTVILYLGRLIPLKGVSYLLEAVKPMKNVELVILGDGVERERLERLSRGLPWVRFLGNLQGEEKRSWLSLADIAVFPSISLGRRHEGLPVALLEAMASGLAVVATDTGGIREALIHGENGLLVPEKDPERLRKSLECLADDPQFRRLLGERARASSRKYDWGTIGQAFLEIYEKLVQ